LPVTMATGMVAIYVWSKHSVKTGGFKFEVQFSKHERQSYREAVMSHSPGLLQPWVSQWTSFSTRNGLRQLDATALRLNGLFGSVTQGSRSGNPWAL